MRKHFKNKCRCTVITLLFCIFSLFIFSTIVYSAFSSTMNINGVGFSRVEADVRITDFSIKDTTNNSVSMYESFGKDFISSEVSLKSNSSITYNLEITNYGSVDVGIYSISGIPDGVNYSIEGYNLKDKICNQNGKCNNYAVGKYKIRFYTENNSYVGSFKLIFNFKVFHKITYTGFTGNYVDCVMDGDSINIDLSHDSPKAVIVDGISDDNYSFINNFLSLYYVSSDISVLYISEFYNYNYIGAVQEFIAPISGIYKIELWGASGNDGLEYDAYTSTGGFVEVAGIGGYGGYTSGVLSLEKGSKLYVYVGEMGKRNLKETFNGGGRGGSGGTGQQGTGTVLDIFAGYSGGGSTDVRLVSGAWNDIDSLRSRIMVAAGGGGATIDLYSGAGGQSYAGGINGYSGGYYHGHTYVSQEGKGGTQTFGGTAGKNHYAASGSIEAGKFGTGGNTYAISSAAGAGGGGGGYFGGGGAGGTLSDGSGQGGGGGSSYISGHEGCIAVSSSYNASNTSFLNSSVHYSGYRFYDTKMIDGKGYSWTSSIGSSVVGMPTFDGNSTMTGNLNNGHAKITLLEYGQLLSVSYDRISGNYLSEVPKNSKLNIDFKENAPERIKVLFDGVETNDYNYENGILTINKVLGNVLIQAVSYDFDYSGNYQTFTIPKTGVYRLEVWGAQGGSYSSAYYGGYGAYAVGDMSFNKDTTLYIFPAGKGISSTTNGGNVIGGFNGGGWTNTAWDSSGDSTEYKQSGGGASHVSLENNVLAQTQDKSKILIVAAGGSGAIYFVDSTKQYYAYCIGGSGGGVVGSIATCSTNLSSYLRTYSAATQSEGGLSNYNGYVFTGSFGKGGFGYCGGGAGYYGGAGGNLNNGGGSSYIGNTNLTNKYMSCYNCSTNTSSSTKTVSTSNVSETPISGYAKSGNGYVRITPMYK